MKTTIKNAIYEILENEANYMPNLSLVDNTRGMNGYPERMSWSIIGFESSEELEKVEQELNDMLKETVTECTEEEEREELEQMNVCRQILHKRDGWNLWEVETDSAICNYFDTAEKKSEEGKIFFEEGCYADEEDFIKEQVLGSIEGLTTIEDMKEILSKMGELWDAISSLEEGEIVVCDLTSWTFETIKRYVTEYSEDTHTYAIALSII